MTTLHLERRNGSHEWFAPSLHVKLERHSNSLMDTYLGARRFYRVTIQRPGRGRREVCWQWPTP